MTKTTIRMVAIGAIFFAFALGMLFQGSTHPRSVTAAPLSATLDQGGDSILNVGATGNDWTANALTIHGGTSQQTLTLETDGSASSALNIYRFPAAGTGEAAFRIQQGSGNGDADNMKYDFGYSGASGRLFLRSEDVNGGSLQGDVWHVADGTNDTAFLGGVGIGASTAPTSGLDMNGTAIDNVGALAP